MATNDHSGEDHPPSRGNEKLENLVALYLGRLNDGERLDRARVLAENPDLGEEILRDLEAFVNLGSERSGIDSNEPLGTLGDYTLRRQIGRGGMGVVYEAWQNSMDRCIALKVLPKAVAVDTRAVTRFIQEAQLAGKLSHPNIVHVHGMGVEEQVPYFAMEFVKGETLAQVLASLKERPDAATPFGHTRDDQEFYLGIARCFADAADGLQHAHSKGIIHRDIKPSNLILDREGRLRILDFGLARLEGQESLTISGELVGTPLYMSPEQAQRKKIPVDHRTDVYSLGATLYEMLALRPPFSGKDHQDTLSQIIERDPVEPRKVNPRVPKDLETIVLKCLQKEPTSRYGTAEALGQDLRRFVRGDPIEAKAPAKWERIWRHAWRHRTRLSVSFVVAVLAMALSILLALRQRDRLAEDLRSYETGVIRAMLRVELLALPGNVAAQLETKRLVRGLGLVPGVILCPSDFEGTASDLHETLEDLRRLDILVPGRPEAPLQIARVLLALDRTEEASTELVRSLERDQGFLPARAALEVLGREPPPKLTRARASGVDRGWVEAWRGCDEAMRRADYREVVARATQLLEAVTEGRGYCGAAVEARLWLARARLLLMDGRAIGDLEVVHTLRPEIPEPLLLQAMTLHALGHPQDAEQVLTLAHQVYPQKAKVVLWAASIYLDLGDTERADRWIERIDREAVRERLRAIRLWSIGEHEAAVAAGRRAVEVDPGDPQAFLALALVLDLRDDAEQAAVLERGVQLHPENLDLRASLAKNRFRQLRYEEGAQLAREILAAAPRSTRGLEVLGLCLFRLGRAEEALWALRLAEEDPDQKNGPLGWAYFNLGRLDEARATYDEAHRRSPQTAWHLRLLGLIAERLGEDSKAKDLLQRSTAGLPRDGVPQYNLGSFLERRGEPEEALWSFVDSYRLAPRGFTHWHILNLLRSLDAERIDPAHLEGLAADLKRSVAQPGTFREKQLLARLLILRARSAEDGRCALYLARQAVKDASLPYAELLATLADAQHVCGEEASALRRLEEALRLPHATSAMAGQLDRWRRAALPEVLTFGSADAVVLGGSGVPGNSLSFAGPLLESYGQGLLALLDGRPQDAAIAFRAITEENADAPEPWLRLAQAERLAGSAPEAMRVAVDGLRRFPAEVLFSSELALLWRVDPSAAEASLVAIAANGEFPARAKDLLALLTQLRETGGVRIDCGGLGLVGHNGSTWMPDAFFDGGWYSAEVKSSNLTVNDAYYEWKGEAIHAHQFQDPIAVSGDADLYRTERWFHPSEFRPGYRIPLPPGRFRVRLHFAETWYRAEGRRVFDVVIEGKTIAGDFDVFREAGFARAVQKEIEVAVDDGLLEIELRPRQGEPFISGIEVEGK